MTKYTLRWEGPGREFQRDTDDPLDVIEVFISFDKQEEGRLIYLPNFWDRLIIEKEQKPTVTEK